MKRLPSNPYGYTTVGISYKGNYTSVHYHTFLMIKLLHKLGIHKF